MLFTHISSRKVCITRRPRRIYYHKCNKTIVTLLRFATEIKEMGINPLLGMKDDITAVDARILVISD